MNQRGFATLEVILMVMVIGILASIAVPRFTAVTTAANTSKIQADLSTIDTAIAIYILEKGTSPAPTIDTVKTYLQDGGNVKPPTGKCYIGGEEKDISETNYGVTLKGTEYRATLKIGSDDLTSGDFTKKATNSGTTGGSTQNP